MSKDTTIKYIYQLMVLYLYKLNLFQEPNSNFVKKDKTGYKLNRAYHPKAKINK